MTSIENNRLDKMEKQLNDVEIKMDAVETKVDKILVALTGDDLNTSEGLINEVKVLKDKVSQLESWKNRAIWMAAGAGVTGGIGIVQLAKFIQAILHV